MTLDEITTAPKSTCAAAPAAGVVFAEGIPVIWRADDGCGRDWDSLELARPRREPLRFRQEIQDLLRFGAQRRWRID